MTMRMIDYYNIAAVFAEAALVLTVWAVRHNKTSKAGREDRLLCARIPFKGATADVLFPILAVLLLAGGAALRLWNLAGLPDGLQQDEASIGYEAFCLVTTGMDRNGYHWPVYPITWGSGGGSPLMIYLNVLTTRLFGPGIRSIRIVPAFLGTLTLLLFFGLLYRAFGRKAALLGLLVLAVMPWHIILSRWSLDSNTTPFWQLLALLLMVRAASSREHRTGRYLLAAFAFAVCLYSYGSANVVIPLTILFACVFLLRRGLLTWRQLGLCLLVFLVVCLPLAVFYGVNFLGLPEISLCWISFPKFTSSHFGSVFLAFNANLPSALLGNLKSLIRTLTFGLSDEVSWNAMPGYWTLYCFTWPVTLAGILFGRTPHSDAPSIAEITDAVLLSSLGAALIFSLFIQQDINREVLLFLPLIYWFVKGLLWLAGARTKLPMLLSLLLLLLGFASFAKDYYGGTYNRIAATDFMPGYGDAMCYADQLATEKGEDATVYSTYDLVASPFMLTLYYTCYDPQEFRDTVVYKDPEAEFRVAASFGHFVFGLPESSDQLSSLTKEQYRQDVFVLTREEAQKMNPDPQEYELTTFKDRFVVIARRE